MAFLVLCTTVAGHARTDTTSGDLIPWPLGGPIKVTSTFGEYRRSHFHAGIDLSTFGVSGQALRALGQCSVHRVRVDHRGYGNTLVLRHDDGHVVTYAHMRRFSREIESCVREMQDQLGHCLVEFYPEPGRIRFAPGEVVGTSGSSGVGPPHLHMEVVAPDGEVVNPLVHWYAVPDSVPPTVYRVVLTPRSADALVNGRATPASLRVRKATGTNQWDVLSTPHVCGEVGLAIRAVDRINGGGDRVGLYRIRTEVDGEEVFRREYARFPADQLRLIDLVYDDDLLHRGFGRCERLYRLPGDHLQFHDCSPGDGVFRAGVGGLDYGIHTVDIYLEDVAGNCSHVVMPLLVNHPPEVTGMGWAGSDTLTLDLRDEAPDACVASFSVKTRGRWKTMESHALGGRRWKVGCPPEGQLLSVTVKDERGVVSRPSYLGEPLPRDGEFTVGMTFELRDGYARITLNSPRDLARPPDVFVAPGGMGYSRATMWAHDERTYGMELLLFPQAAPGFRIVSLVESTDGDSGKVELFVPLSPISMAGSSVVCSDDGGAWISAGPDAVFQDTYLEVGTRVLSPPSSGLEVLTAGYRFGPETALLKQPVVVGMRIPPHLETAEGVGIFRWTGGQDYRLVPGVFEANEGALLGSTDELGMFVLMRDPFAPVVSIAFRDGATIGRQRSTTIRATVRDRGSGIDPDSVQMFVDGHAVPACPEGDVWVHRSRVPLPPGTHPIRVEVSDKVGNWASAESEVTVK